MHRIFGIKENVQYLDRKGAYLIPINGEQVGVIQTPKGYFFLGGGLDENETDEVCIARECMEEAGYEVLVQKQICSAEMYEKHQMMGYFHPIQTYDSGELTMQNQKPIEEDHFLVWINYSELKGKMYLKMQNWALDQCWESKDIK